MASVCALPLSAGQTPISTDRPSQSAGPGVVPRWSVQLEAGYKVSRSDSGGASVEAQELPDLLVRFGLMDAVEARFVMDGWSFKDSTTGRTNGFNDVSIGAKWSLAADEKGWRPQTSILSEVKLPVGDVGFTDDFTNPKLLMLFASTLTERLGLTYNFGSSFIRLVDETRGDRTVVDLPYTAMLSGSLDERWDWFAEIFGAIALDGREDRHTFQAGVTALVGDRVQLDVRGGIGLVSDVSTWLAGTGVGFRVGR